MNRKRPTPKSRQELETKFRELNTNLWFQSYHFDQKKYFLGPTIATLLMTLTVGFKSGDKSLIERIHNEQIRIKSRKPLDLSRYKSGDINPYHFSNLVYYDSDCLGGVGAILGAKFDEECWLSLDDWLKTPAHIDNASKESLSREAIIQRHRNKEGGAHVDPQMSLDHRDKMQNVFMRDHSTILLKLYHCVRQIAHEYLITIEERDKALSNKKTLC